MFRYVYAVIMAVSSVLAFYLSSRIIYNQNYKRRLNRVFSLTAFGSGLWSIGYAGMFAIDNETLFAYFRAFGMCGLVLFLIACQFMLLFIAEYKSKSFGFLAVEALVGIVILALTINPACIRMNHTSAGIITEFLNPTLSLLYTLYMVGAAASFTVIVISIIRSAKKKRIIAFAKQFLVVEILVVLGMVVDTVLPAFGLNLNIPASTLLQFIGLELIYIAVHKIDRNKISLRNMAGYIYLAVKTPMFVFDVNNRPEVINKEAEKVFKLEDIDKETYDFWGQEFGIRVPGRLDEIHDTLTINCTYKNDTYFEIYVDPIHDDYDDYLGYIVTANDVTETINNIRDLETARNEALSANKAKSLFLANMSHEIRTPMNSILGFSELALKDDIAPAAKEYFEDIHNSASVLLATINDILDISKIESGKMELVCADYYPARMFKEVSLIIGMQAEKKQLGFEMTISPDFPSVVFGDKAKIREILINLLNNSVKYTKEGKVMLTADFTGGADDNGTMVLKISDTGIGIKEEEIDTIFNIFQRVDLAANSSTEGTGLGLSITRGYVDLMGGKIEVASTYGKGSTFTVTIGQKVIDASPISMTEDEKKENKRQLKFRDIEILAVDDSKVNLKVISKAMVHYGLNIDVASSGAESIEKCKNKSYDIVLMDQMMPNMDGVEAMSHIRELGNGYEKGGRHKIIVLTANAIAGSKDMLVREGFDDYIGKPINFSVLEQVLTDILPDDKYYYEPDSRAH